VLSFVVPSAAQTLEQLDREYLAARSNLETARLNWEAQEQIWLDWMDSTRVALASGNDDRVNAADSRVLLEATVLQRRGRAVEEATANLATRRRALQDALDLTIDQLLSQLPRASVSERARLNVAIDGHEAQAAQLRTEERELEQPMTFLYVRLAVPDPRAGVGGIQRQIQSSERRISEVEERIAEVTDRIASLQRRIQRARQAGDAAASLGRFGAGDLVGASPARDPGSSQVATGALTPQDELEQLTTQLELLEGLQRQLSTYVADLRGRIPRGGGIQ
jgi:predicted  nucleic acid-binding Zn-ribbon protein